MGNALISLVLCEMVKKKTWNAKAKLHRDILGEEPRKLVKFHRNPKYAPSQLSEYTAAKNSGNSVFWGNISQVKTGSVFWISETSPLLSPKCSVSEVPCEV